MSRAAGSGGESIRPTVALAAILAAGFLFYAVLWREAPRLADDSAQYVEVGRDLADFSLDALHDRSIGYPLLLVLTGSRDAPTRVLFFVSLALHLVVAGLLIGILRSVGVGRTGLTIFGLLVLLPPFVEPSGYVMTENLAEFMLAIGVASLVQWCSTRSRWWLVLSASAFAYSGLTRPVYQALGLAVACVVAAMPALVRTPRLTSRDAYRAAAVLVAGSVVILGVVASINKAKFGFFGITPSLGFHLSTKTMPFIERLPEEYAPVREILVRERDQQLAKWGGTHTGTQTIWSVRADLARATGLSTPDLSRYLVVMNARLIMRAPIEYGREVARSAATYWFPAAGPLATLDSSALRWVWALVHVSLIGTFFLQMVTFIGLGLYRASVVLAGSSHAGPVSPWSVSPEQLWSLVLALSIIVYTFILSCTIDIGDPRQRSPTDVLIVFACVLGSHIWWHSLKGEHTGAEGSIATGRA